MSFYSQFAASLADFSLRVKSINPFYRVKSPEQIVKTALNAGIKTDYFDHEGFSKWSSQYSYVPGATNSYVVKLYATWQDDTTAFSSCVYVDVTNDILGVASIAVGAGTTQSGFMVDNLKLLEGAKYIKHEVVISGGASDSAYTLNKNDRV